MHTINLSHSCTGKYSKVRWSTWVKKWADPVDPLIRGPGSWGIRWLHIKRKVHLQKKVRNLANKTNQPTISSKKTIYLNKNMTLGLDQADIYYVWVTLCKFVWSFISASLVPIRHPLTNPGVSCEVYSAPFSCDGRTNKAPLLSWMQNNWAAFQNWYDIPIVPWQRKGPLLKVWLLVGYISRCSCYAFKTPLKSFFFWIFEADLSKILPPGSLT